MLKKEMKKSFCEVCFFVTVWDKNFGFLRSTCPPSNYSCPRDQGGSEGPGQHSTSVVVN